MYSYTTPIFKHLIPVWGYVEIMSLPSVNIAQSFFLALSPWIYILGGFASVVFALTRLISSHIKQCNIETGKVVEP